jgi:uncharacterized protein (TIGR02145 family)
MKTKTIKTKLSAFTLLAALFLTFSARAQVTIGSGISPTRAALLDLKARQDGGTLSSVSDDANVTAGDGDGGLLLPRVKLVDINTLEPFISENDPDFMANTGNLKERLAGLMVYNLTNNGINTPLYPAVYTWDGTHWVTSQINEFAARIKTQPEKFTFYEKGTETAEALIIELEGAGTWAYQWYQVTGNNVHVRIGTPIGGYGTISGSGATTESFSPAGALKGTTRSAGNTGFYKFYCEATSDLFGTVLTSDIAEVAVGCGAKNNEGEWLSFMCFNLGAADNSSIASQKSYPVGTFTNDVDGVTNRHAYITGEEKLWGSLFQWGRIADGHELRSFTGAGGTPTNILSYNNSPGMSVSQIGNGSRCFSSDIYRPNQQVKTGSDWFGMFIHGMNPPYNWTPIDQTDANQLWRNGRFIQNDPCAHYKVSQDGITPTYLEFWHNGTDETSTGIEACDDSGTGWRIPSQDEWGAIYKGGAISGLIASATANTWSWHNGTTSPTNYSRGHEIKPDGETTTLFLPASGHRDFSNGMLYGQSTNGSYWSSSVTGNNAYYVDFGFNGVTPVSSGFRAYGFALRCIKDS